ncbi:MAG TPA: hypothetical protein VGS79_18495 [Puia sp.]|nr:hypothetical protein [Puia sp.]
MSTGQRHHIKNGIVIDSSDGSFALLACRKTFHILIEGFHYAKR